MLAERNKRFRIAAALVSASYLILAGRYFIDTIHVSRPGVYGGYVAGSVLFTVGRVLGVAAWGVVAMAFGREIDWRRLCIGGAMVALVVVIDLAGSIFYLLPVLAHVYNADYRASFGWYAVGELFGAAGCCVAVAGFTESGRGARRARLLWIGAILGTVGYGAQTLGVLFLNSFYSSENAVSEATTGELFVLIGVGGLALAGVVFATVVRRPLVGRESGVRRAALIAVAGSICIVAGYVLIAVAYGAYGGAGWEVAAAWLQAVSDAALIAAFVALALGARTVVAPAPVPA
jgi:hypothetical protein